MKSKLLIYILVLAALLRFFDLGKTPPGLYWDEVSLGYNAYSISQIAKDEHNEFLPITRFKAFGDYKPPGYIYAAVPFVALMGPTDLAVRLPSAIAGWFTVLVTFYLVKELFPKQKNLAELSALFLAISPWHIQISRVAFESNLAALFNLLGVLFFIKGIKRPRLFIASAFTFVLSIYTFNANRLLAPLLVALLVSVYFRKLLALKKPLLVSAIAGIILIAPLVPHLRSSEGKLRWNEVNIFSNLDVILDSNSRSSLDGGTFISRTLHHRYIGHAQNFFKHYFDHFNGRYLFLTGDQNPRFSIQDVGGLYLINLPLLILGLFALTKVSRKKSALLVFIWFLLGPIAAATARETPHALRSLSTLPTFQIIISLGFVHLLSLLKKGKAFIYISYFIILLSSLFYFQYNYYHYYPKQYAGEWLTSYPRLVKFLAQSPEAKEANQITVITDYGRPYIYFLFYNRYSPSRYLEEVNRTGDVFGFYQVHGFSKYRFARVNPEEIVSGDIYVVRSSEQYDNFKSLTIVTGTNGEPQFNVLKKL